MYKRRLKIFLALMAAGVAVVIGRLAHLQLVHGSEYREQAERMLTYVEMLPTARGRILDCKGRVLACDDACAAGMGCEGGVCDCLGGLNGCAEQCVDLQTDHSNCGACIIYMFGNIARTAMC